MAKSLNSRRDFLAISGAAGAAFLLADTEQLRDAVAWAVRRRAGPQERYQNLTAAQGATLEAAVARLIPSDDGTPGAREAGVIHFIDRMLGGLARDDRAEFEQFVAELDRRAAGEDDASPFAELAPAKQDELLRAIEGEQFFVTVRDFSIGGMFVLPSWGGNRDWVGWSLIGQSHEPVYQPPFGWYDANPGAGG